MEEIDFSLLGKMKSDFNGIVTSRQCTNHFSSNPTILLFILVFLIFLQES